MVMTAEFETGLSRDDLSEDGRFLLKAGEDHNHRIAHDKNWLLFQGLRGRAHDASFARHSGLNLETGQLFVGNVQDESPAIRELTHPGLAEVEDGAVTTIRASLILELERLFDKTPELRLRKLYSDGNVMEGLPQSEAIGVTDWASSYRNRITASLLQRPTIEDDFTTQARLNRSFRERAGRDQHSPRILSMVYGERLYAELKKAYPRA